MSNLPVDRDSNYMHQMWGTSKLVTDYQYDQKVLQEVIHDNAPSNRLTKQTELHEKIRNDEDYDDWQYGLEPTYIKNLHKYS